RLTRAAPSQLNTARMRSTALRHLHRHTQVAGHARVHDGAVGCPRRSRTRRAGRPATPTLKVRIQMREITLAAGDLAATFVPRLSLVGSSLKHRGEELLGMRGGLEAWAQRGRTM